jgi:NAD(P)-dependent dehydrogenase (short-subunit alcohol dehydrogenase family)
MFRLDGKVAVVIGGAGGIGEACAKALSHQGAKVVVASRSLDKLQGVAGKITADTGSEAIALPVDVTSEESVASLTDQVVQKFKTVDILVNSQGSNVKMPSVDIDFSMWDSLFAANVRGMMLTCKAFGRIMVEKKKGKIINLSSVRGIRGMGGGNTIYGATKGAVDMITRMLAAEWAAYHVNVNAIGPSVVITEMMKKATTPERLQAALEKTLFKRFCTAEDVAGACVYLAAPESDYVTGQILYVDGGLTAIG